MNSNYYESIIIDRSTPDSRSLIMPHQQEAVDALTEYFKVDKDIEGRNGIVVMPTGSGKTYTAVTWLLSNCVANGYRVVWLVHRQELVEQTYQEFRKQAPILRGSGIRKLKIYPISGNHLRMNVASRADIYVCSIASVANRNGYRFIRRMLGEQGKRRLVIVVDEAHHATAGNYQKVIQRMTTLNPNRLLLGLTATPYRMQPSEQRRFNKLFNVEENLKHQIGINGYIYEVTLKQLITSGFLAEPKYKSVETEIIGEIAYDVSDEDRAFFASFGELSEKLKAQIAKSSARNGAILNEYLRNRDEYGKTLIFAVNQMHAETLCQEFRKAGISCDYAVSDRPDAQDVIRNFKKNEFKVLINVQIMTEGSDVPDIQTVFLTRETNSDSLLMQMIGRALRGERAGGTKTANIIAFHDTWDRYMHWLDPGTLEIFGPEPEESDSPEAAADENYDIFTNEQVLEDILQSWLNKINGDGVTTHVPDITEEGSEAASISSRELYLKLYELMRAALMSKDSAPVFPCGWYSVVAQNGEEKQILVFESQLGAYRNVEKEISLVSGMDIDSFITRFFSGVTPGLIDDEVGELLDYIEETGDMPPYFTFKERSALDPARLAEDLKKRFSKDDDREIFLKELYEKSPVLQNIYRYFFAFKKTIFDAMKEQTDSDIVSEDERQKYNIIDDYYDLDEMMAEIKEMYPQLDYSKVSKVSWSTNIVKDWCALCQSLLYEENLYFQITVNRLFSSPQIDREAVKYLLFHELLHANGWWAHDRDFREREWQYPNSAELDGIIDSISMEYHIDRISGSEVSNETPEIDYDAAAALSEHMSESKNDSETSVRTDAVPVPQFNADAKGVEPGYKYCRNCGNRLPETARFCDKCGEKMDY